jgi:hypothetical protein
VFHLGKKHARNTHDVRIDGGPLTVVKPIERPNRKGSLLTISAIGERSLQFHR